MRIVPDKRGFTFLEVIVAVAIIAIVFTAALKMVSQSLALRSVSRFYSIAPYLASVADENLKKTVTRRECQVTLVKDLKDGKWKSQEITKMAEMRPIPGLKCFPRLI